MTSEAELMKEKTEYYRHYKKFMEMKLEQSMAKTAEYQVFAERYPHITESIRLEREMERLKKKLKFEKRSSRFQIKREMNVVRAKLRKQNIWKRLRGESKQEAIFHTHFIVDTSKMHVSSLAMRCNMTLRKTYANVQKRLRRSMYKNLPPSIFDLKSLDTAEKGLEVREWIQKRCKKLQQTKKSSSFTEADETYN